MLQSCLGTECRLAALGRGAAIAHVPTLHPPIPHQGKYKRSDQVVCLNWCWKQGAKIMSMSFGDTVRIKVSLWRGELKFNCARAVGSF